MKDSFILYTNQYKPIARLNNEQLGRLLRQFFEYHINGNDTPDDDIAMAFDFFKNQFDIDTQKYIARCERNKRNANERWHPDDATACDRMQMHPIASDCMRMDAIDADNDNDNDNENEYDNDNENDSIKRKREISDEPKFRASELAPGCGIDDDVFVNVIQSYNAIMKCHPMTASDLTESRRNSIAYYYRQMGGDMTRIESVFKIIAKKDKNAAFDDIFNHPSFVPVWLKAKNGTNQTNQKS